MAPLGVSRLYAAAALLLSPLAVLAQVYPPTPQQQADAAAIIAAAFSPANNASAWTRLAYITDTFGPRMSGSPALSAVIDYIAATAASVDGLKVTLEPVQAPHWVRGVEWAQLESPRAKRLHACGAGYSNSSGSPPAPITADVIVVGSQAELISRAAEAVGKIVLFDWPTWQGYGTTVEFRYNAASWTAAVGGVGALFKSVTYWGLQVRGLAARRRRTAHSVVALRRHACRHLRRREAALDTPCPLKRRA